MPWLRVPNLCLQTFYMLSQLHMVQQYWYMRVIFLLEDVSKHQRDELMATAEKQCAPLTSVSTFCLPLTVSASHQPCPVHCLLGLPRLSTRTPAAQTSECRQALQTNHMIVIILRLCFMMACDLPLRSLCLDTCSAYPIVTLWQKSQMAPLSTWWKDLLVFLLFAKAVILHKHKSDIPWQYDHMLFDKIGWVVRLVCETFTWGGCARCSLAPG